MNSDQPSRLLRSFERYLRAGNRSERTVSNYLEGIRQAEAFLRGRGVRLEDATRADLEDFMADLLARRSAATAATRYKVLRILYGWLRVGWPGGITPPGHPTRFSSWPVR
jgi:site-specific recombinase XerD